MNLREKLKSPFPFYLNDDRKNTVLILGISLFVAFFLQLYRPYFQQHVELTLPQSFLFAGVTFAVLYFNIVILPHLFPKRFDPVNWTIGKYLSLTLWHLVAIGMISTAIDELFICPERTLWQNIVGANVQVALTGIMPITVIFLFLKNKMLTQNLRSALVANGELEKIKALKKEAQPDRAGTNALTLHSETSETLTFHPHDLLFVEADDNYSTVVWKNGSGVQKKLLRANLKSIENQINNSFALRCHRSFIVNINAISNISGNTNGYKLQILDTDFLIPVSRPKGKEVIEKIQQLRVVMEMA